MEIIDNINRLLGEDLKRAIAPGAKLKIAAASFSIYAFEALKEQLQQVESLEFIFTLAACRAWTAAAALQPTFPKPDRLLDTSNAQDVYYSPDQIFQDLLSEQVSNLKGDRSAEDLLFQVLTDWGVDLALPLRCEDIVGRAVYFVDDNAVAACFEADLNEDFVMQLAARKPLRVVCRDSGFANDSVKINVEQIFKLLSPATEITTI